MQTHTLKCCLCIPPQAFPLPPDRHTQTPAASANRSRTAGHRGWTGLPMLYTLLFIHGSALLIQEVSEIKTSVSVASSQAIMSIVSVHLIPKSKGLSLLFPLSPACLPPLNAARKHLAVAAQLGEVHGWAPPWPIQNPLWPEAQEAWQGLEPPRSCCPTLQGVRAAGLPATSPRPSSCRCLSRSVSSSLVLTLYCHCLIRSLPWCLQANPGGAWARETNKCGQNTRPAWLEESSKRQPCSENCKAHYC